MNETLFSMSGGGGKGGKKPRVRLFTDGACSGNPGPGGWAYILKTPDGKTVEASGGEKLTTNNRMELMGVIRGLEALPEPSEVHLVGDSEYVLKGLSEWLAGWKRRGWKKADKKPVMNADLWQEIDRLTQAHVVKVEWTRGHSGHEENERCDALATAAAARFAKR
jgi:ribonuclease HI